MRFYSLLFILLIAFTSSCANRGQNHTIVSHQNLNGSVSKDDSFISAVKSFYLQIDTAIPKTDRFAEYEAGLDYDVLTESQDPYPVKVTVTKIGNENYNVQWSDPYDSHSLTLVVKNESGILKIDNVILADGHALFDYSKPASYYNVWLE